MQGIVPLLAAFTVHAGVREPSGARDPFLQLLNDSLVWGPVGALLGAYLFFRGFRLLKRKRLVLDTPRSTVRAAALGPVEIGGQADGPYTLISPLSKTDCYYYRLVVRHLKGSERGTRFVEECVPLFLNDGTGDVMVDPRGAELQFPALATLDSAVLPDYLFHFLTQHGISTADVADVKEFCIRRGDNIVIFATLEENTWRTRRTGDEDPLGRIGPGFLSEAAADVQRRRAFKSLDPSVPSGAVTASARHFELYPPTILTKGSGAFFIANCSQRELVQSLRLTSALYIWGGPALTLFCAYWLLHRVMTLWPR